MIFIYLPRLILKNMFFNYMIICFILIISIIYDNFETHVYAILGHEAKYTPVKWQLMIIIKVANKR